MEAPKSIKEMEQQFKQYAAKLQEQALASTGKYVAAGYAGNSTETSKLYCYCGYGNGYNGSAVRPASLHTVVFDTEEAAQQVIDTELQGLANGGGKGERIAFKPMPANEYFWLVYDDTCHVLYTVQQHAQELEK